jgi:hypothetical protein
MHIALIDANALRIGLVAPAADDARPRCETCRAAAGT